MAWIVQVAPGEVASGPLIAADEAAARRLSWSRLSPACGDVRADAIRALPSRYLARYGRSTWSGWDGGGPAVAETVSTVGGAPLRYSRCHMSGVLAIRVFANPRLLKPCAGAGQGLPSEKVTAVVLRIGRAESRYTSRLGALFPEQLVPGPDLPVYASTWRCAVRCRHPRPRPTGSDSARTGGPARGVTTP